MKTSKKVLITASVFAVVVNMNGCGLYGPPPDDSMYNPPTETPIAEVQITTQDTTTFPIEPENRDSCCKFVRYNTKNDDLEGFA